MNITSALMNPDKTPLSSVEFKVVALYPGKTTAKGDIMTKVMVDTPQGADNCYVTFFTPVAPNFVKGDEVLVSAQITGQGAKGISVSDFNGKKGINVNKEATWGPVGGAAVAQPAQPVAQPVAAQPTHEAPTQAVATAKEVVTKTGGVNECSMNRSELIKEFAKIYSESRTFIDPVMNQLGSTNKETQAHEFALMTVKATPLFWFGNKTINV